MARQRGLRQSSMWVTLQKEAQERLVSNLLNTATIAMRGPVIGILCLTLCTAAPARSLTWTRVEELPAANIETLQLHGTTLFASSGDRVYRGTDQGTTWTASNPVGAGSAPIFTVIPAGGALWAGSFGQGVFRSPDDGLTWNSVNSGLAGIGANHITEFAVKDGILYAGTDGSGVFALALATPTTWTAFNNDLPLSISGSVSSILLHGTTLVAPAGPYGLIHRFPQGATAWQEVAVRPPLLPGFTATDIFSDGTNLLVSNGPSVYQITNDAQSWTLVGGGLANGSAVFFAHVGATVFAVVDFLNNTHQFYSSPGAGETWQSIDAVDDTFVFEIESCGRQALCSAYRRIVVDAAGDDGRARCIVGRYQGAVPPLA